MEPDLVVRNTTGLQPYPPWASTLNVRGLPSALDCIHLKPALHRRSSTCTVQDINLESAVYRDCSTCTVQDIHLAPAVYRDCSTWPAQGLHLSPALRGLEPRYILPRPHLRLGAVWSESDLGKSHSHRAHPHTVTKERLWRERLKTQSPDLPSPSLQSSHQLSCSSSSCSSSSSSSSSLPFPSCSCCLSTLRASSVLDPSSPWAFTMGTPKERKSRCSQWWVLLAVSSCCVLVLVLGLLYIYQATPVMEHGVTEY